MRQGTADKVQALLPKGWTCRVGQSATESLPFWLVTSPDGQVRSLMGLHRLTEEQLKNRIQGLVTRVHFGAHAK